MNAKELSNLLEKYNIGHVLLEKTYSEDDEIYAYVINTNGTYSDKIIINDNTSGFETETEICEEDYKWFEICDLQFYHTAWAYPCAGIDEPGGGIDVAEKNCGIRLVNDPLLGNQIDLYTEQAIKMFIDPLKYQNGY